METVSEDDPPGGFGQEWGDTERAECGGEKSFKEVFFLSFLPPPFPPPF